VSPELCIPTMAFSPQHPRWQRMVYVALERATARITSQFVAVSEPNRVLGQSYGIFRREECSLIRSGVDFADFRAISIDKIQKKMELGLEPSDKIVRRGILRRRAASLPGSRLKNCDRNSRVCFVMVGDGSLRQRLDTSRTLGISSILRMLGWKRCPRLLRTLMSFSNFSLGRLPRSLVEAFVWSSLWQVASTALERCGRWSGFSATRDAEAMAAAVIRF
jgi:hypothetical protein